MHIRLLIILFTPFVMLSGPLVAQSYIMDGSPITDCDGTFFDPGGSNGNYLNNQTLSTTICSNGASGTHIRLSFSGADLAPGDALCFYDGQNLAAPLLACHSEFMPGQPFLVQASAVNPSGCLTVSFTSDASGTASGWAAAISCVPSCQTILAEITSTTPAIVPADTGWIDICPGQRVFFNGNGNYPQNNFAYAQSDLTTSFEWNFGDGGIAHGPATSHMFNEPGGYFVQLTLTDQHGCNNTNLVSQRIRVAPKPAFQLAGAFPQIICSGDTLSLSANANGSGNGILTVIPGTSSFSVEGSRSDSLSLPDGSGISYETPLFFSEFSPGQILTDPEDLEGICVIMEHSWARDLEISLTCPNGQSIILHDHPGNTGGEVFLGVPNDMDNSSTPIPGLGYNYCWTNNAPNPTWLQYANTVLNGSGTLPAGDYTPYEPISDLVGCPLNGEWTITVTDWWPLDNGFIFNWSLMFDGQLYPNIETFTPAIIHSEWKAHPSVFFTDPVLDSIAASPQNAGSAGYTFLVQDAYGCSWDTLIAVKVLPRTHPDCLSCNDDVPILRDTTICNGESVPLNAASNIPAQEIRFESYPDYTLGNGNHPHNNPYYDPIDVNSLGYPTITNPIQQITSVCIDIETDYCSDLNIFLQAPGGQLLELSSGNGGSGDNYKITCFTATAPTSVIGQTAPFNGNYRPEGNWNSLAGTPAVGNWLLRVSDGFAPNNYGKVKWWSIGFKANNTLSYSWTNINSLSCSNCPNPVATPSQSSTYNVSISDVFGCVNRDTVQINVTSFFPAPGGLVVSNVGSNNMTWSWNAVSGALGYQVSINGGPWLPANGNLMHTINGLSIGQNVTINVRAISPSCTALAAQASAIFGNCTVEASLGQVSPALCAGDSTGSALITVTGGSAPLQYFVDNWPVPFSSGDLQNVFPAGNHRVIVRDVTGCADTVNFNIASPPAIVLNTSVTDVLCNGLNTGSATVSGSGGTGTLGFVWQPCNGGAQQNGPNATMLTAGCYAVTATDGNGCKVVRTVTVTEPTAFVFSGSQTPVSCFGGNNGTATMSVTGGVGPYSFKWDNGQTTQTATGYTAGFHTVSVTDANNCQKVTLVQVMQPPALVASSTDTQPVSCFGGSNGSASVTMSGGTPPYSYSWNNGQTTQTAQNIPAGPHAVTVTDDRGCTTQLVVTVSEPFQLTSSINNVVNERCAGLCNGEATAQPSGGTTPYSYTWNNPLITPGVQTATGLCPGTYTVTIQDAKGCSNVHTVNILAGALIQVQYNSTVPTCAGLSNGTIAATASGGTQPYQYHWENGSNTANLQNAACGVHYLTVTDAAGCTKIDTISLDCPPAVIIDSITVQHVRCFGESNGSALVHAHGGVAPLNFQWSDATSQTGIQANNLAAGNYTVTVSDANNCSSSATAAVLQPAVLSSSLSPVSIVCFNASTGSIMANPTGGTAPYSYEWSPGGNTQEISGLPAGTYTVTITDANQCSTTNSATLTQPTQGIQLSLSVLRAPCFEESNGEASVVASGGGGAPFTYLWSNGQQTAQANNLAQGSYTVTVTDASQCTATETIVVNDLEKVSVNVAFVPPSCYGVSDAWAAVNLISGGIGMGDTAQYQYQWSIPGVYDAAQVSGLSGDSTYSITVTDFQGCSGTFSFVVNQPLPILLNTISEQVRCFGETNGLASITGVLNANQPVTYAWSNSSTDTQISDLAAGIYTVTVTDTKGCNTTQAFTITEPPVLKLSFQQLPLLCSNSRDASISAYVEGGTPAYLYQWSGSQNIAFLNQIGPGQYDLTVTDKNGCTITGSQTIIQPDSIFITPQNTPPDCFGERDGRIKLLISNGQAPYRYSLNDGDFGGSSTFIALPAGIYTLRVRDANGCVTTITDTLTQPPAIGVELGQDTTIILGDSLLLSAVVSNAVGTTTYQWGSALVDSLSCVDAVFCDEIWVKPLLSNTYILTLTDENGCVGKGRIRVTVEKPRGVYVPTGFSPNGDLNNDILIVHGLSRQVRNILTFRLFDRWGELVYEDRNFAVNETTRGWDGRFRGQDSDPGVYVWVLEAEYIDGHRETLKGNVTLIR